MKILQSFKAAINGIITCFISEANFKIHAVFAAAAVVMGFIFTIAAAEWLAVIFCIALVAAMEMMNTALEKLCDVVHRDLHDGIKKVKDMAAGAVLLSAVCSAVAGAVIFLPKIIATLKHM